jgi:hypothetical protein
VIDRRHGQMEQADILCFRARVAISVAHKYPCEKSFEKAKDALNKIHEFIKDQDILLQGAIKVRLERPEYSLYIQIAEPCD